MFFKVVLQLYNSTISLWIFYLLHILVSTWINSFFPFFSFCFFFFLIYSTDRCVVVSYCGLSCICLMMLDIFSCAVWWCVCSILLSILYWPIRFLFMEFWGFFIYLDLSSLSAINPLSDMICRRHFPIKWFVLRSVFWKFKFWWNLLIV